MLSQKEITRKIKKIEIKSKLLSRYLFAWKNTARIKWSSWEFDDIREYTPWDLSKNICWKTSTKHDKLYSKTFTEDKIFSISIILFLQESLFFWKDETKFETALTIIGTLMYSQIKSWNKFSLTIIKENEYIFLPYNHTEKSFYSALSELIHLTPKTTFPNTFDDFLSMKRKIKFKKSDFFIINDSIILQKPTREFIEDLRKKDKVHFFNIHNQWENNINAFTLFPFLKRKYNKHYEKKKNQNETFLKDNFISVHNIHDEKSISYLRL